ncbi:exopolyphosphatase [Bacillus infantis]|uniref:Exopolyphosphatase n=1 Tax=Bacillus infantis TaxID=324767 RepID=A0A5D4RFU6_9BACI|nr:exopolyphosphatase [Bacillus infantis]
MYKSHQRSVLFLNNQTIALIDLGSNSIQMAIYNVNEDLRIFHEVERVKVAARLINHLNEQGFLTEEGIQLIITIFKEFQKTAEKFGTGRITGYATAVIRNSLNQEEILAEIAARTDIAISVISGYEEACYGYLGVINSMNAVEGITLDIGGGSTEITLFRNREMVHYHSFQFGAVNLHEAYTKEKRVTEDQLTQLRRYISDSIQTLPWLNNTGLPIIGIGGSAKNLSRIHNAKFGGDELKLHEISSIFSELSSLNVDERSKIKGLSKKRRDIILPAIGIVCQLMETARSPHFVYCDKTVRDGIMYKMLEDKQ